jgi:hypothetical protein
LNQIFIKAQDEIAKAIDVGAFMFSSEALARLKRFSTESDYSHLSQEVIDQNIQDWLEHDVDATKECLHDIIEIAKKDLKTTN